METDLIQGLLYSKFDDIKGSEPLVWTPSTLDAEMMLLVCVKAITLLAGEGKFIPKSLTVIPFPSQNLKGVVRYFQWPDETKRGGLALAFIIMLFHEVNDVIFYKYIQDLEPIFNEISQNLIELEENKKSKEEIASKIGEFEKNLLKILEDLRNKELSTQDIDAFPDDLKEKLADSYVFKIIIVGDPEVGKTSAVLRFTDNAFKRTYLRTIGVNITRKHFLLNKTIPIQFVMWDVAGQSRYSTIRTVFYKGSEVFIILFDLTDMESFENVRNWHQDIVDNLEQNEHTVGFLVGNKADLVEDRKITKESASKLADELNLKYFETSALTGENIKEFFQNIADSLIK